MCVLIVFAFRVCSNSKLNCFQRVSEGRKNERIKGKKERRGERGELGQQLSSFVSFSSSLAAFFVVVGRRRRLFWTEWAALFIFSSVGDGEWGLCFCCVCLILFLFLFFCLCLFVVVLVGAA